MKDTSNMKSPATAFRPAPQRRKQSIVVIVALIIAGNSFAQTNPMVHRVGTHLENGDGQRVDLRGVNLGGWLLWEGWIMGDGIFVLQTQITNKLTALFGAERTASFREHYYDAFIAEKDIARIAQAAAHGGQSRFSMADPGPVGESLWESKTNRQLTVTLWREIARRYRDRTCVAAYDLLNEPDLKDGSMLTDIYRDIIDSIRTVDPQHLVMIEGGKLATDFSMFTKPLADNMAYSFHMYTWFGDDRAKRLATYTALAREQNRPLWVGEFGENSYEMIAGTTKMYRDHADVISGWAFWTWKKAPTRFPGLCVVEVPADWN